MATATVSGTAISMAMVMGSTAPRVFIALCLTGGFMVIEAIGGILSGSLALLADAGHMLTDTVALFLTWLAFGFGMKPADHERTYGYHRFPILAAFTNGICMLFIVGWIFVEAVQRMYEPVERFLPGRCSWSPSSGCWSMLRRPRFSSARIATT